MDALQAARLSPQEIADALGTDLSRGLTQAEAKLRLARFGANVVAHEESPGRLKLLLRRALNPLVILLLVLATTAIAVGDAGAALMMLIMIGISIGLGTFQESRSNRAAAELEAMVRTSATVLREGASLEISQTGIVPGEVVSLSAGDLIPADLVLTQSKDLAVSQALLTGESLPVHKHARLRGDFRTPLEAPNLCFMGTSVLSGVGTGVVLDTGTGTMLGRLARSIVGQRAPTRFDRGISDLTWLMIRFIGIMVPAVFLINGLLKGNWSQALLFALSVGVGLTPEMLPMIVTVNLAKGALDMAKLQVIVKRLNSIQNFGGMDILCTDKTGTLTRNEVILQKYVDLSGEESRAVLEYAYLNSAHQTGLRNLMDSAVVNRGAEEGVGEFAKKFSKIDEVPFDFDRKRMSVILGSAESNTNLLICKGATEEVTAACRIEASRREALDRLPRILNQDGFRVLALAIREFPGEKTAYAVEDEAELTLIGYLAFLDPPKDSAAEAIQELHESGVAVKILTGDNEVITRKICGEVGIGSDRLLLGTEIDALSDGQLAQASERTSVFAKLNPGQKARIIRCLQQAGHVVGYLGDGINDGPALRAADVGISVDSAVDIAKESADIILLRKSLTVLHDGVIEGRRVFTNILKYIRMNASSNFGNTLSMLGASAFLPFLPMQPIQILMNNLLYDFSQTTLPTDRVDEEPLREPQAWDTAALTRFILVMGPISSIFDTTTFLVLFHAFGGRDNPSLLQTGWFVESLATQTLIIHVIRTRKVPFLQSRASAPVITATALILLFAIWAPGSALAPALRLVALPGSYWPFLGATLLSYAALAQWVKSRWLARRPSA